MWTHLDGFAYTFIHLKRLKVDVRNNSRILFYFIHLDTVSQRSKELDNVPGLLAILLWRYSISAFEARITIGP